MTRNKKIMQIVILAAMFTIGLYVIVGNLTSGTVKYPKIGDKAPDFALAGMDGKIDKLSNHKGKTVLLNFWGTFCPPCKAEMPAIQRQYEKWKPQGMEVLAVNLDPGKETVQSYLNQYGIDLPVLLDSREEVRKKYGVSQYPTTFFIQSDGTIHSIVVGEMVESFIENTLSDMKTKL